MKKIVLATGNAGKVKEINHILEDVGFEVIAQTELGVESVEETGLTFIENALLKARHAAIVTGLPALADDSGLSVNCLNGAPGIYSARYSGIDATDRQNLEKLLLDLKNISSENRQAAFHCALVFLRHAEDPVPIICYASWPGIIIDEPIGEHGFGYDPIFYLPEFNKTAAEMTKEEKHRYSHRGQALKALLAQFTTLSEQGLL